MVGNSNDVTQHTKEALSHFRTNRKYLHTCTSAFSQALEKAESPVWRRFDRVETHTGGVEGESDGIEELRVHEQLLCLKWVGTRSAL